MANGAGRPRSAANQCLILIRVAASDETAIVAPFVRNGVVRTLRAREICFAARGNFAKPVIVWIPT